MSAGSSQSSDAPPQQTQPHSELKTIDASFKKLQISDEGECGVASSQTQNPSSTDNLEYQMERMKISVNEGKTGVTPCQPPEEREDKQATPKQIHICHYNCRTLKGDKKLTEMDNVLSKIQCDVIGLAETKRDERSSTNMTSRRVLFNSPSDKGRHGVGFVVASHLTENAVFEAISPRLATLQLPAYQLHLVEAYAPTLDKSEDVYDGFMKQVAKACRETPPGYRLILLGDFNARVKRNDTNMHIVGDYTYGKDNKRGVDLVNYCREFDIRLLNTFEQSELKERWTHKRARGTNLAQIDYIAANIPEAGYSIRVLSMEEFKYTSDHRLLSLHISRDNVLPKKRVNRCRLQISHHRLAPIFCKTINSIINSEFITEENTAVVRNEEKIGNTGSLSTISLIPGEHFFKHCEGRNIDKLHTLKMIIEKSVQYQTGLFLAFLDVRTALDVPDWKILSDAVGNSLRSAFARADGVMIGETSFNLLTSDYNYVIIAKTRKQMKSMLRTAIGSVEKAGMRLKAKNTVLMTKGRAEDIEIDDNIFKFVSFVIYLGCRISIPFDHDEEVKRRVSLGHAVFNELRPLFCSRNLPKQRKRELFEVFVSSITLHGSETWALKADARRMLQASQRQFESNMLEISELDEWPEERIRQTTGIKNWLELAAQKKVEWAEKLKEDRACSAYICTWRVPQDGRPKRGKSLRWSDHLRYDNHTFWYLVDSKNWEKVNRTPK